MNRSRVALLCLLLSIPLRGSLFAQSQLIPEGLVSAQAASFVLGQRNFSDISFCTRTIVEAEDGTITIECVGPGRIHLGGISGIAIAGNKLIVADSSYLSPPNHNRILIYNDLSSLKGRLPQDELPAASVVVGQLNFDTTDPGTSRQLMNQPVGVATDGTRLFVADWGNNRVLIYNQIPEIDGAEANVVVGQSDFISSGFGPAPNQLRRPNSVFSDGVRMMIADTLNNRVLIYNSIPTQNGASANVILGSDSTQPLPPDANTMWNPMSATTDGQRLIVSDLGNNRVLIYNQIPAQNGTPANVVVGQPDITSNGAGNTATSLNFPRYAFSDGTRLVIADSGNNRILIYNQIPTQNGAAPDVVLGQEDFLGLLESCAASNFAVPYSVASDGEMLFVSDGFNRRVLGFRPGPALVGLNGVVNGASFSTVPQTVACDVILLQPPVARGGIASIFGTNMADTTVAADSLPLPKEMGGVKVKFNGMEGALFYVSPDQINVQVPWELEGFSASMEIEKQTPTGTVVSAAAPVGLANGAPGIFTLSSNGAGAGVVVHADFSPVTEESPAVPGEALTVFATGLGTVDQPVLNGAGAQFGATGSVTIGGTAGTGQTATITVNGLDHSYTTVEGDSLDDVVDGLVDLINQNDPNVTAFADPIDSIVNLRARVFGDEGTNITYTASVPEDSTLTAQAEAPNLAPSVANVINSVSVTLGDATATVPGNVVIGGTPGPDQTVTVTLSGTDYSYTTVEFDTLETIVTSLASLINDPNVSATANTATRRIVLVATNDAGATASFTASVSEGATLTVSLESLNITTGTPALVTFAGLVQGFVGSYQVNFLVPATITPNLNTKLRLTQNLIIFGSVTRFDIVSNTVTFPVAAPPAE